MKSNSEILGQLAMAQALYHELGRMVKTGDPENLRGRADAMLDDGVVDKLNLRINGKSVGTLSNRYSTPETFLVVEDAEKFAAWLAGDGFGYLREWVARGCKGDILKLCASALVADGEIPDGCRAVESGAYRIGTVIKGCKADEVAAAFAGNLPQAVVYALTGEVEP
jgi:hypothetical protein